MSDLMEINKNTLDELLKAYKDISKILENIDQKDVDEIKLKLEIVLTFPLGEAIYSLFDRIDVNTLEKSLEEYINNNEETDSEQFLNYISLYLKRIHRNNH